MIILQAIGHHFLIAFREGWEVEVFLNRGWSFNVSLTILWPPWGCRDLVPNFSPSFEIIFKEKNGHCHSPTSAFSVYVGPIHFVTLLRFELCLGNYHCIDRQWFLPITCNSTPQLPSSEMTLKYRLILVDNLTPDREIVSLLDMKLTKWSSASCIPLFPLKKLKKIQLPSPCGR